MEALKQRHVVSVRQHNLVVPAGRAVANPPRSSRGSSPRWRAAALSSGGGGGGGGEPFPHRHKPHRTPAATAALALNVERLSAADPVGAAGGAAPRGIVPGQQQRLRVAVDVDEGEKSAGARRAGPVCGCVCVCVCGSVGGPCQILTRSAAGCSLGEGAPARRRLRPPAQPRLAPPDLGSSLRAGGCGRLWPAGSHRAPAHPPG
jgi:hypothetical protein